MLSVCEALEAEHLPGVVEARFMGGNGARPRGQVLRPPVLLGQRQVDVGRARVKGQRASVCNEERKQTVFTYLESTGLHLFYLFPFILVFMITQ